MPYRQSAAKRKEMKVSLELTEAEIAEAIYAFVKEKKMIPPEVDQDDVKVFVTNRNHIGLPRNECKITFIHEVLEVAYT